MRKLLVFLAFVITAVSATAVRPERADASLCYVATGAAANVLCWLDMSSANLTSGATTTMSWTLPDGSVLQGTLTQSGAGTGVNANAIPDYSGAALGHTAYTGVGGKPAIYGGGTFATQLSSVIMTDPQGHTISTTIAGADSESLDTGDAAGAYLSWSTNGPIWSQLQIMTSVTSGTTTPICTLANLNTANPQCTPSASGNNAAYILETTIGSANTLSMGTKTGSLQGYAFAVNLASLTVVKNISSRVAGGDQFTVSVSRSTTLASATTSGTGTGVQATASVAVVPSDTYTLSETSSGTPLSRYATTYACSNANTSSTTSFPASGSGTSVAITPGVNDQITCTFTNYALTSTNTAAKTTATVQPNSSVIDNFTFTNTTAVPANFGGTAPTLTSSAGGTITPTGYSYNGTTYTSYANLLSAINASPTAANGSVTIGVVYPTPATAGTTVTVVTSSYVTFNGTSASPAQTAQEVDTVASGTLSITKTGTSQTYAGGPITYTIVASNSVALGLGANGATLSDPVPSGLTAVAASCTGTTGGATCPNPSVSGNTVTATISNFPSNSSVTFSVTATAGSAAGYTNTASLTATNLGGLLGTTTVTASATTVVTQPSTFQKTVQNVTSNTAVGTSNTALPGDQLQYTLNFLNTTGVTLHGISLTDPLPTTVTYATANCGSLPSGVTCSISAPTVGTSGTVIFSYTGTLPNGSALSATINAYVK